MAKKNTIYICSNCTYQVSKWTGKCPECGEWNSFEEQILERPNAKTATRKISKSEKPLLISEIDSHDQLRVKTGINEFDRVLGGGIVPGSLVLIGGEPGIGKSTLLTSVMGQLVANAPDRPILYVSGEESSGQIAQRMKRLKITGENFFIYHETNWQNIQEQISVVKPAFIVLDSIQTTISSEIQSAPGTVSQVREVTYELMNEIKSRGMMSFVIGHITKDGSIAGPKILEHMVDTVIYFEGDQHGHYRVLRGIKNRFGSTNEVGVFEMTGEGLKEVPNPSQYFLDENLEKAYGRSLTCVVEGSRSIFVELQALVVSNHNGNGRRTTHGIDNNRLSMLIAVLEKYLGLSMSYSDVFLNVVGGIRLDSRESDLSIIASILSSYKTHPIEPSTVFVGEVGLTGEVRATPKMEMRLREMSQLNYRCLVTSKKVASEFDGKFPIKIIGIEKVTELENFL